MNALSLVVILSLVAIALAADDCKYVHGDDVYNLLPMKRKPGEDYSFSNPTVGHTFYVNICAQTSVACNPPNGACQKDGDSYFGCGNANEITFGSYNPNPAVDGTTVVYGGGELCNGVARVSYINIACGTEEPGVIKDVNEQVECRYSVMMSSKCGCKNANCGGGGGGDGHSCGGIDCGWIIIIVCSFLFIVYLVAGAAIKYKKFDADPKSLDIIPNVDFWTAFPFLIKDGVVFSIRKISCNRVCSEYSEI